MGSGSHTPLEVATAMAVIANGGFLIQPHFIQRIENEMGDILWEANPVQPRAILVLPMLQDKPSPMLSPEDIEALASR